MGRQRAFKLVAKCYKNSNTMIEKLNAEKEKMEELRSVSRKRQSSESRESPDDSCIPSTSQLSLGEQDLGEKVNKDCEPRLVDDVAEHSIPSKKPKTEVPGKTIKTSEVQEETASDEVMVEVTPGNLPTPKAAKKKPSEGVYDYLVHDRNPDSSRRAWSTNCAAASRIASAALSLLRSKLGRTPWRRINFSLLPSL